jgi:hypothetical protein
VGSDDSPAPAGQFRPICPECGKVLSISPAEREEQDRLVCLTHGDLGSRKEMRVVIAEQARRALFAQARLILSDVIDRAGIKNS